MPRGRLLSALVLSAALVVGRQAFADEAAARVHFKKGIDLYDKKDFADALAEFQAAYRERPSAGIKQNIALSLKGMNRPAEAATAFDEALDEGKDTLKPETRTAIERELTELSKTVATVNVTLPGADEKQQAGTVITIQPVDQPARSLAPGAQRRPIRLLPAIYTFTAHIPGWPDAPPKKLALVSGAPVDVTWSDSNASGGGAGAGAMAGTGTLTVRVNVADASIILDGVEVGHGTWAGPVPAKRHTVEVSAKGWREVAFDVSVPPGAAVENPVTLQPIGAAPPEYVAPMTPAPKEHRVYLAVTGALDVASYRLTPALDEPAGGKRQGFVGLSIGGRFGYLVSKLFALEAFVEVGDMAASYKTNASDTSDTKTNILHWQITPMVRFQSHGKVRFTAGTGLGLHGLSLSADIPRSGVTVTEKGDGISASWILDSGVQFDLGPLFLETVFFVDVHGTGTVKSDDAGDPRLLYASPGVREGLRVGLGIPF